MTVSGQKRPNVSPACHQIVSIANRKTSRPANVLHCVITGFCCGGDRECSASWPRSWSGISSAPPLRWKQTKRERLPGSILSSKRFAPSSSAMTAVCSARRGMRCLRNSPVPSMRSGPPSRRAPRSLRCLERAAATWHGETVRDGSRDRLAAGLSSHGQRCRQDVSCRCGGCAGRRRGAGGSGLRAVDGS